MISKNAEGTALLESLRADDRDFIKQARGYRKLIREYGFTLEHLAAGLGKSRATIVKRLRLLKLPQEVQNALKQTQLTERHARALLRIPDIKDQMNVLEVVQARRLGVRQTEELVEGVTLPKRRETPINIESFSQSIKREIDFLKAAGIMVSCMSFENKKNYEMLIKIPKG